MLCLAAVFGQVLLIWVYSSCYGNTSMCVQVHRWVNYESMLKECLVGRMATVVKGKYTNKQTHRKQCAFTLPSIGHCQGERYLCN